MAGIHPNDECAKPIFLEKCKGFGSGLGTLKFGICGFRETERQRKSFKIESINGRWTKPIRHKLDLLQFKNGSFCAVNIHMQVQVMYLKGFELLCALDVHSVRMDQHLESDARNSGSSMKSLLELSIMN
jgi:hypothetical protein